MEMSKKTTYNLQSLALPTELSRGDGSLHLSNANRTRDLGIPSVENGNRHVQDNWIGLFRFPLPERERERTDGVRSWLWGWLLFFAPGRGVP